MSKPADEAEAHSRPDGMSDRENNESNNEIDDGELYDPNDGCDRICINMIEANTDKPVPPESYAPEWIWSTSFQDWLSQTSTQPFWISGGQGSGRSTLISYLAYDKRSLKKFESTGTKYNILRYFYDHSWRGSQSSTVDGKVHGFLHQLASKLAKSNPTLKQSLEKNPLTTNETPKLLDMICDALKKNKQKMCVFIDGLDNYYGSLAGVIHICCALAQRTGIKLVLASHIDGSTAMELSSSNRLLMRDYNQSSMRAYTKAKIDHYKKNTDGYEVEARLTEKLVDQMIERAQGILVWYKLVFDNVFGLCLSMADHDDISDVIKNNPQGLTKLYNGILTSIPAIYRHEAALILLLVKELKYFGWLRFLKYDNKGPPKHQMQLNGMTDTLDCVLEILDFLHDRFGENFGIRNPKSHRHMAARINILLNGLLEVYEEADKPGVFRIRAIHNSLHVHLNSNNWIRENLHPKVNELFPNELPLRLAVMMFEEMTKDQVIEPDLLRRCIGELQAYSKTSEDIVKAPVTTLAMSAMKIAKKLVMGKRSSFLAAHTQLSPLANYTQMMDLNMTQRMFYKLMFAFSSDEKSSPKWKKRSITANHLTMCLLELAAMREEAGVSSTSIIAPAMKSYLRPWLAYRYFEQGPGTCWLLKFFNHPNATEIVDLMLAVMANLPFYYSDRIKEVSMSTGQQQDLGIVIMRQCAIEPWNIRGKFDISKYLYRIKLGTFTFTRKSLCFYMAAVQCPVTAYPSIRALNDYLIDSEVRDIKPGHHQICHWKYSKFNLLLDWVLLRCKRENKTRCDHSKPAITEYEAHLKLVLKTTIQIQAPCYPGGTAMHALFDFALLFKECKSHNSEIRAKFVALLMNGFNISDLKMFPEEQVLTSSSAKSFLKTIVLGFKSKVERQKGVKSCEVWVESTLRDVNWIVEQLEIRKRTRRWGEEMQGLLEGTVGANEMDDEKCAGETSERDQGSSDAFDEKQRSDAIDNKDLKENRHPVEEEDLNEKAEYTMEKNESEDRYDARSISGRSDDLTMGGVPASKIHEII